MNAKEKAAFDAKIEAASQSDATNDDSSTAPYALLIPTRKARKVVHRRFATCAGALAEARGLREQGTAVTVEGPPLW